ncbi:hypothetical protein ENHYDAX1_220229 [Enhydrobacter sp. AX1]|nr:hypothetical protein ENHYDAX1_220229 [Enhydrobacter sp. AX1]
MLLLSVLLPLAVLTVTDFTWMLLLDVIYVTYYFYPTTARHSQDPYCGVCGDCADVIG